MPSTSKFLQGSQSTPAAHPPSQSTSIPAPASSPNWPPAAAQPPNACGARSALGTFELATAHAAQRPLRAPSPAHPASTSGLLAPRRPRSWRPRLPPRAPPKLLLPRPPAPPQRPPRRPSRSKRARRSKRPCSRSSKRPSSRSSSSSSSPHSPASRQRPRLCTRGPGSWRMTASTISRWARRSTRPSSRCVARPPLAAVASSLGLSGTC